MNTKLKGALALLLAAIIFGSFGIWIRILNNEIGTYEQIFLRNTFAALFALIFLKFRPKVDLGEVKKNRWNILLYAVSVPLAVIAYVISVLNTTIAMTIFSFYIGSITGAIIISSIFFKEKWDKGKIISLCLAIAGLLTIIYPFEFDKLGSGFLWGIAGGLLDSISNAFRKDLGGKIEKFFLVALTGISGIVIAGLMIVFTPGQSISSFIDLSLGGWLLGALFGFLLVSVNYLVLIGFKNFDLTIGTVIIATEIFFTVLFGVVFLAEQPKLNELIGGLLIFLAAVIPSLMLKLKAKN
ncbi:MAG TPA: DMT family transporter [Candidatus Dojkabacteria bacterium]|nr:DMT family transporter [Candidatus Dojkabacteria bacterium]